MDCIEHFQVFKLPIFAMLFVIRVEMVSPHTERLLKFELDGPIHFHFIMVIFFFLFMETTCHSLLCDLLFGSSALSSVLHSVITTISAVFL